VTLQYVRFLELAFCGHTYVIEDVGQRIRTALMSFLMDLPMVRKEASHNMKKHMIAPLEKAINESPVLKRMREKQPGG
jgi:hypothetical protein